MKQSNVIDTLNGLIETCRDGEFSFRDSAERAQSPELQALFSRRSDDCALAAADLAACVRQLGGEPDAGGSTSGALHRGWAAVRKTVGSYNDLAMLEECERGEDVAMQRYREALQTNLPEPERTLVTQQFEGVKRNHAQVRALRDQERALASH
jgi:uncharacterized protein (TIGR02284 family)